MWCRELRAEIAAHRAVPVEWLLLCAIGVETDPASRSPER